jgi:hypothetical protein
MVGVVCYAAYPVFSDFVAVDTVFNALQFAVALLVGVLLFQNGMRNPSEQAGLLIGLACIVWSVGQLFWNLDSLILGNTLPFPSAAEASYIGSYLLMLSALARLKEGRTKTQPGLLVVVGTAFLVQAVAVVLYASSSVGTKVYTLVFSLLLYVVVYAVLAGQKVELPVKIGMLLLVLADIILVYQLTFDPIQSMVLSNPLYVCAFFSLLFMRGLRFGRWRR